MSEEKPPERSSRRTDSRPAKSAESEDSAKPASKDSNTSDSKNMSSTPPSQDAAQPSSSPAKNVEQTAPKAKSAQRLPKPRGATPHAVAEPAHASTPQEATTAPQEVVTAGAGPESSTNATGSSMGEPPNDLERLKLRVEVWKEVVATQRHFNDIEMKIRGLFVSVTAALFGAMFVAIQTGVPDVMFTSPLTGSHASLSAVKSIALVGISLTIMFRMMDMVWYHPLLKGAVTQGEIIEKGLEPQLGEITLAHAITAASGKPYHAVLPIPFHLLLSVPLAPLRVAWWNVIFRVGPNGDRFWQVQTLPAPRGATGKFTIADNNGRTGTLQAGPRVSGPFTLAGKSKAHELVLRHGKRQVAASRVEAGQFSMQVDDKELRRFSTLHIDERSSDGLTVKTHSFQPNYSRRWGIVLLPEPWILRSTHKLAALYFVPLALFAAVLIGSPEGKPTEEGDRTGTPASTLQSSQSERKTTDTRPATEATPTGAKPNR